MPPRSRARSVALARPAPRTWRFVRAFDALLGIALAALVVKLIVLAQLGDHPLLQPAGELDSAYYVGLAERVRSGDWVLGTDAYFLSPLYVYFLGGLFTIAGPSLFVVRLVQVALGAVAVFLIGRTTRLWYSDRTALAAAGLAALCGLFTFYEIVILQAALDPFLTSSALFLVSRAALADTGDDVGRVGSVWRPIRRWFGAGVVMGLYALNRPNALPYSLIVALFAFVRSAFGPGSSPSDPAPAEAGERMAKDGRNRARNSDGVQRGAAHAVAVLLGVALALAPMTARNYLVAGEVVPISSHGGLNFYIGNAAEADGTYRHVPGITPSIAGQARDARAVAEKALGRSLGPNEVSNYFYGLSWRWIAEHPRDAALLQLRKIAYLMTATPLTLNYSYTYYSRDEPGLLRFLAIGPAVLIPFGLVGLMFRDRRRPRGFWVWAAFVPAYGLSVVAFFISSRYRMPLLVPLCSSAAAALETVVSFIRHPKTGRLVRLGGSIAALALVANWNMGLDDGRSEERTQMVLWLIQQGREDVARARLRALERTHPQPGVLEFRVGNAFVAKSRLGQGIGHFLRALEIDAEQPEVHAALGRALVDAGRSSEAVPHLRRAYRAGVRPDVTGFELARSLVASGAPGSREEAVAVLARIRPANEADATSWHALGELAIGADQPAMAERFFREAVRNAPGAAGARERLGVALSLQGRHAEALDELRQAAALTPGDPRTQLNLAVEYGQQGKYDDARAHAEEAVRLQPDYEQARAFLRELARRAARR